MIYNENIREQIKNGTLFIASYLFGSHKDYWKEIRFHILMTPIIFAVMFLSYNISIYVGWREPISDMAIHIPTFLGALVGYIFLAPFFNYYMKSIKMQL